MDLMTNSIRDKQSPLALANRGAYLLENECGLPKDSKLTAAVSALRTTIADWVERGKIEASEMDFLINVSIDIMPESDPKAAALKAGFDSEASERIESCYREMVANMRNASSSSSD